MMKDLAHTIDETLKLLKEIGIDANGLVSDSIVYLTSNEELKELSGIENCIGLAIQPRSHFFIGKYPAEIYLSNTLKRPRLESVLGHEIFHIYSGYNNLNLSKKNEEGAAELVSYYIFQRIGEFAKDIRQQEMLNNPDNIYGDGFRMAYEMAKREGGIKNYFSKIIPNPKKIHDSHKSSNKFESLWSVSNFDRQTVDKNWWKSEIDSFPIIEKTWWNL